MDKLSVLRNASFGSQVAEDEYDHLKSYFVETEQWRQIRDGRIDVIYGPKGSGKSALYLLLLSHDDLSERDVIVIAAEEPRGTPVFTDIAEDPPTTEAEFRGLWKLYFLSLIGDVLDDWGLRSNEAREVVGALSDAGLREPSSSLRTLLRKAADYAKSALRVGSIEGGTSGDPATGIIGVHGKITFHEPSGSERTSGSFSVDDLLETANRAIAEEGLEVWLALDRLDVAFAETPELEENALRSLFRAYVDMLGLDKLRLKIFLRNDIWQRITESGFREASHITRQNTLTWDDTSLLHLIVRRALNYPDICSYYNVDAETVLADMTAQEQLFYRIFPDQVERGARKSTTLKWMVGRTRDATNETAPRELIHLVESARNEQLKSLEIGQDEPSGETLIAGAAIKGGLPAVSQARLERTLYAEYPECKRWIERLENQKTEQTDATLAQLWGVHRAEASERAQRLAEIGFFEQRGTAGSTSYWVPFLYRDSLNMVQGRAEQENNQ